MKKKIFLALALVLALNAVGLAVVLSTGITTVEGDGMMGDGMIDGGK